MDDALPADLAADLDRAFPRLVAVHQDRLYSIALRLLGDPGDAEEVAQDAFVRAYRAIGTYERERTAELQLRPWLTAIVVNLCRNRFRRRRPVLVPIDPTEPGSPDPPSTDAADSPPDVALRAEAAERLTALLAELPDRLRTPVVLRHVADLSYEEIATALDRPEGTVKAQVHRGLARLRAAVERAPDFVREEMTA